VLTGERPEVNAGSRRSSPSSGSRTSSRYVVWVCEQALQRGLLPHTNLGVVSREDLARLREVTASQGLMLESVNPDLVAHQGSPTKHPRHAWRRSARPASCGSRSRAGSSSASARARGARRRRSRRSPRCTRVRPPAGGDHPELRPAPELLRAGAGGDRRRGRRRVLAHGDRPRSAAGRAEMGL
jgi:hypothetical protein